MKEQDGFTRMAKKEGLRARSAYKLRQLNNKFKLIRENSDVLDLGSFPGGWLLVARELTKGKVVGIDLNPIEEIKGVDFYQGDASSDEVLKKIGNGFDVVISDMAPKTTGIKHLDVGRSIDLGLDALEVAEKVLKPKGNFLCKVFQGAEFDDFIKELRKHFRKVVINKPEASKKRSKEIYVVGLDFKVHANS